MYKLALAFSAIMLTLAGCTTNVSVPDVMGSDGMVPDTNEPAAPMNIQGGLDFRTEPATDFDTTGRTCISANITIPKVDGATLYTIHAHGFNDPLFFGTTFDETLDPNNPRTTDGGGKATPQIDEGTQWSQLLSGGCALNPDMAFLMSRFDGMIVDVTVTFD